MSPESKLYENNPIHFLRAREPARGGVATRQLARLLVPTAFIAAALAQEVTIPDPALKAAVWQQLGKPLPVGSLTEHDMMKLTQLSAPRAGVKSLAGLGAAHNLTALYLDGNELTSLTLPSGLTNLTTLALRINQLTSLVLPGDIKSLTTLLVHTSSNLVTWTEAGTLTNALGSAVFTDADASQSPYKFYRVR